MGLFLARRSAVMSIGALTGSLNFPSVHQIYGTLTVEAVVLSVGAQNAHVICNPWSFTITGNLAWEPWISTPLLTVQLTSDIFVLEHSKRQVAALLDVVSEFRPLLEIKKVAKDEGTVDKAPEGENIDLK